MPICVSLSRPRSDLNDVGEGGETVFPGAGIEVRPRRGLGILHFPARLPAGRGARDARAGHEGACAIDEKWICQQWCWTGPLQRDAFPDSMRESESPEATG